MGLSVLAALMMACLPNPPGPTALPLATFTSVLTRTTVSTSTPALPTLTSSRTPTLTASPTIPPSTSTPPPTQTQTQTPTPGSYIYIFPVQPIDVATYPQGHHDYPAVDILAPVGSLFVAVTDGVVDFVSMEDHWAPKIDDPATRGGLSVAIIGDDGVRYYGSHLSEIAPGIVPGVRITAGQWLGYTGQTGNARFVAPHLHFGISHPTFPEDWAVRRGEIDPYLYLQAWAAGTMRTPKLNP